MFCCTLLNVHSSIAIILMGKRELVALLYLSSWCLVMVEWLFLTVPWGCLRFVIVVFPDHTHLLFLKKIGKGMPKIESENQFLTSIKGRNSVLNCQNLPICNPRTILPNINSHSKFEENLLKNAPSRE